MGHASAQMTLDRYGHLFPELDETIADRLDEVYLRIGRDDEETSSATGARTSSAKSSNAAARTQRGHTVHEKDARSGFSAVNPRKRRSTRNRRSPAAPLLGGLEAAGGIEPPYGALQAPDDEAETPSSQT